MHTLTNCTITKVESGPSGTSAHGAWHIHNIWINSEKQKYSYFEKDGFIPVVGTMLTSMGFDVEQKGQYTNFTIKEMVAVPTALPAPAVPVAVPAAMPAPAVQPAPVAAVQPVLVAQPVQSVPVVKPEPVPTRELMMCVAYAKDVLVHEINTRTPGTPLETLVLMAGEAGLALFNQLKVGKQAVKATEAVGSSVPTVNDQPVNSDPVPPVLADADIPF